MTARRSVKSTIHMFEKGTSQEQSERDDQPSQREFTEINTSAASSSGESFDRQDNCSQEDHIVTSSDVVQVSDHTNSPHYVNIKREQAVSSPTSSSRNGVYFNVSEALLIRKSDSSIMNMQTSDKAPISRSKPVPAPRPSLSRERPSASQSSQDCSNELNEDKSPEPSLSRQPEESSLPKPVCNPITERASAPATTGGGRVETEAIYMDMNKCERWLVSSDVPTGYQTNVSNQSETSRRLAPTPAPRSFERDRDEATTSSLSLHEDTDRHLDDVFTDLGKIPEQTTVKIPEYDSEEEVFDWLLRKKDGHLPGSLSPKPPSKDTPDCSSRFEVSDEKQKELIRQQSDSGHSTYQSSCSSMRDSESSTGARDESGLKGLEEISDWMLYEPVYQVYHQRDVISTLLLNVVGDDDDIYEELTLPSDASIDQTVKKFADRRAKYLDPESSDSLKKTLTQLSSACAPYTRHFWSDTREVKRAGVLKTMSVSQKKLQESLFEILTSETSYMKSLNIAVDFFMESFEKSGILTPAEMKQLFSNLKAVRDASKQLQSKLEDLWSKSVKLDAAEVCAEVEKICERNENVYVSYCSNAAYQGKMFQELGKRSAFESELRKLEADDEARKQTLNSFLLLPAQRVMRMPMLIEAVRNKLAADENFQPDTESYAVVMRCLCKVKEIAKNCEKGARKMQNLEQLNQINSQLKFVNTKTIPIVQNDRFLLKMGDVTSISLKKASKFALSPKRVQTLRLIVFNDLVLVAKKKSPVLPEATFGVLPSLLRSVAEKYEVCFFAPRNVIDVRELDNPDDIQFLLSNDVPHGCQNIFSVSQMSSGQCELLYVLSCKLSSDRMRWIDAFKMPMGDYDQEKIYCISDCPQYAAIKPHIADEADELDLREADIVNVLRKSPDGWYEGERQRDGRRGWFRADHVIEIDSEHARQRTKRKLEQLGRQGSNDTTPAQQRTNSVKKIFEKL